MLVIPIRTSLLFLSRCQTSTIRGVLRREYDYLLGIVCFLRVIYEYFNLVKKTSSLLACCIMQHLRRTGKIKSATRIRKSNFSVTSNFNRWSCDNWWTGSKVRIRISTKSLQLLKSFITTYHDHMYMYTLRSSCTER